MAFIGLLSTVLVPVGWLFAAAGDSGTRPGPGGTAGTNSSSGPPSGSPGPLNGTGSGGKSLRGFDVDSSMMQRALYVLIAITGIGVLYFLIRAVRLKRPGHKKKYGLLSNYEDSVEMEAVESDEDDTLYEARSLRR